MKKLLVVAALALALTACHGVRGIEGGQRTCLNANWLGISINELIAPCTK